MTYIMKSPVGSFRSTFAGKHPCRIFTFAFERIDAGSIRKFSGNIFLQVHLQQYLPMLRYLWHRNFGNLRMRK